MLVAIRADASSVMGSGHVMRCLSLADGLRAQGAQVTFVCRQHNGNLIAHVESRGFKVASLPVDDKWRSTDQSLAHSTWLGADMQDDASATMRVLETLGRPAWLVVDHYSLDERWESALRPHVERIFVIDDLADRRHDCDLLLDQSLLSDAQVRYVGKVPSHCGLMFGPEFALIHQSYRELHESAPIREGNVRRIMMFFGGADQKNLAGRALLAFLRVGRNDVDVDLVVQRSSPHLPMLTQTAEGFSNIHIHNGLPSLAGRMMQADIAVGAGGATSWERLCLGLPAVVVTLADNQRPIADGLHQRGLVRWLGDVDEVDETAIERALRDVLSQELDPSWSRRCLAACDGRGVLRACTALRANSQTALCGRRAKLSDEELLLTWVNDPETRQSSFSTASISVNDHKRWFSTKLRDVDNCQLFIIETLDSVPVGQVRFEKNIQHWHIHYSIAPYLRRRGLGRAVLATGIEALRRHADIAHVAGEVKADNIASMRVFESLHFQRMANPTRTNAWLYVRAL